MTDRREFLAAALALVAEGCAGGAAPSSSSTDAASAPSVPAFELDEVTLDDLGRGMASGRWTAKGLAESYLARIDALDRRGPALHAVLETNPDAIAIAEKLDAERKAGRVRGPLHGVPLLVKDNLDTGDRMQTTAGSLALVGAPAPRDSFVVQRLREAGAVLIGKTNLSEWANLRSSHASSGWSARGGQCKNPYALDRNPSGSSSGTGAGIAANFAAIGVGTETDGSITSPSNNCGLVGMKPTVGRVSRAGIIPISAAQDTAGPMTRTVKDAALLLLAMSGVDPRDPATAASAAHPLDGLLAGLRPNALAGARLGVARKMWGFHEETERLATNALETLKRLGATLVDPADIPTHGQLDEPELEALLFECKVGLAKYFVERGATSKMKSLADVIAFDVQHRAEEMPYFGQDLFEKAQAKNLDAEAYKALRDKLDKLSRADGIDAVMDANKLDAMIAPTSGPAWPTDLVDGDHFVGGSVMTAAAVAGYPHVTVPLGLVSGLPVGFSFFGRAWSEAKLFGYAFAFEAATRARRAPRFLRTIAAS